MTKSLSPQLIIIRGPIGAGKSSLIDAMRHSLQEVSVVEIDTIKKQIDITAAVPWRLEVAIDTALFLTQQLMSKERVIIVDIHSSRKEHLDKYVDLAKTNRYKATSFLLYPPLEVCKERFQKRLASGVKNNIDDTKLVKQWQDTVFVEDEVTFKDPQLSPDQIAAQIIAHLEG